MTIGKLYLSNNEEFVGYVDYQLQSKSPTNWWGELILIEYQRISDKEDYLLELDDQRKARCRLRKRVNRAVSGVPPRYVYHFTGTSSLA